MENGNKTDFRDETADEYRRRIIPKGSAPKPPHGFETVQQYRRRPLRGRLIVVGMAATQDKYRRLYNPNS